MDKLFWLSVVVFEVFIFRERTCEMNATNLSISWLNVFVPQKVTFIQSKKKEKNYKISISWFPLHPQPSPSHHLRFLLSPTRIEPWLRWGGGLVPFRRGQQHWGTSPQWRWCRRFRCLTESCCLLLSPYNSHTLMAKTSTLTNSVDIVYPVGGKVIDDD